MKSMKPLEICKVCGENPIERGSGGMYKHNRYDRKLAKEYCEDTANSSQTIKPIWRKCCGTLDYYKVTIKLSKEPAWQRKQI
jgi:hypothetical protein